MNPTETVESNGCECCCNGTPLDKDTQRMNSQHGISISLTLAIKNLEAAINSIHEYVDTNDLPNARAGLAIQIGQALGLAQMAQSELNKNGLPKE